MSKFIERADLRGYQIEDVDTTELDRIDSWLPKNGVLDLNIAEQGLIMTLHAQNFCQEEIIRLDRLIGYKEGQKNKAWSHAALEKAKEAGYKTAKDKEWFSQADDSYIEACNELTLAKAAKKWFENKASYYSSWHYAFKTFLSRDYFIERLGNTPSPQYNIGRSQDSGHQSDPGEEDDFGGDINWNE